jgi:hypothetical protein
MPSRASLAGSKLGRVEIGELVTVAAGGSALDGIVFDVPSRSKVVVAVVDPDRGPLFRTVGPGQLTEREKDGSDDRTLRLLIRRTPAPIPGAARGAAVGGQRRSGFSRGSAHRPTGR